MGKTIGQLDSAGAVQATDLFELERGGVSKHATAAQMGVSPPGGTPADLVLLEPCQWFALNSHYAATGFGGGWVYNDGVLGVGATITASGNGALLDLVNSSQESFAKGKLNGAGTIPTVGDRVFFLDSKVDASQGIYTIQNVGSAGTKWVLVRATDADSDADSLLNYRVDLEGTICLAVSSRYGFNDGFTDDTNGYYGWSVFTSGGLAVGYNAMAFGGSGALALGIYAEAPEFYQAVLGSPSTSGGGVVIRGVPTAKTGDFTLAMSHMGQFIPVNKATAVVATLPLNAVVAYPIGTTIEVGQQGAGAVTVAIGGGGTLIGTVATVTAGNVIRAIKVATNTWWCNLIA